MVAMACGASALKARWHAFQAALLGSFENKHFDRSAHAEITTLSNLAELLVNIGPHGKHDPLSLFAFLCFWSRHL